MRPRRAAGLVAVLLMAAAVWVALRAWIAAPHVAAWLLLEAFCG